MQVSRLLYVIDALLDDYADVKPKLAALQSSLGGLVSQPPEESHEDAFHSARTDFLSVLQSTRTDALTPSCFQIVRDLGGDEVFGQALRKSVEELFAAVPFLPSTAQKELKSIKSNLDALANHLRATQTALKEIGIHAYVVEEGSFDLGILIPNSITQTNVDVLTEELAGWSQHIKTLTEIASGQERTSLHYTNVDSGSFDLFISIDPPGAIAVLTVIGGIMKICQMLKNANEKKEELEREEYPDKVINALEEHIGQIETTELLKLQKRLIDESPVDVDRKNELGKAIKIALNFVFEKIRAGVDIEVMAPANADEQFVNEDEVAVDEAALGFDIGSAPLFIQRAASTATKAIEHARREEMSKNTITHVKESPKSHEAQDGESKNAEA